MVIKFFGDKKLFSLVRIINKPGIKKQIIEQKNPPKMDIYDKISSKIALIKVDKNKTEIVIKKFLQLSMVFVLKINKKKEALNEL